MSSCDPIVISTDEEEEKKRKSQRKRKNVFKGKFADFTPSQLKRRRKIVDPVIKTEKFSSESSSSSSSSSHSLSSDRRDAIAVERDHSYSLQNMFDTDSNETGDEPLPSSDNDVADVPDRADADDENSNDNCAKTFNETPDDEVFFRSINTSTPQKTDNSDTVFRKIIGDIVSPISTGHKNSSQCSSEDTFVDVTGDVGVPSVPSFSSSSPPSSLNIHDQRLDTDDASSINSDSGNRSG